MDHKPGISKWLAKRKPEEMSHGSDLNCCVGTTQRLTWAHPSHMSIHNYCTLFPPNKYFTCFTSFRLCGNSFLQTWRAKALVTDLTFGLVARIWCCHHHDPAHLWLGTQASLQAFAGQGHQDQWGWRCRHHGFWWWEWPAWREVCASFTAEGERRGSLRVFHLNWVSTQVIYPIQWRGTRWRQEQGSWEPWQSGFNPPPLTSCMMWDKLFKSC